MKDPNRRQFLARGALGAAATGLAGAVEKAFGFSESGAGQVKVARPALPHPERNTEKLYGLMVDAARAPEDISYYRRLIDFCHDWHLNALLFSLTDDQGSALRFATHPELITHPNALTPDEARELATYSKDRGVDLIPIVESFGHTRYITGVPQYAHLADGGGGGKGEFNGVIPVAPETLKLMADLYREAAEIFPSRYLHGGCDEVNWGGSDLSQQALRTHSRAQIWADYLNSLDQTARGFGKELIVWGDYVLHKEPDILPLLAKDIIIMDWQYYETDPKPLYQIARQAIEAGHRVIGAPAIISCRWGPRAARSQLENIEAYSEAYRRIDDPKALGVIVTNWVPSRYIQNSLWDTFAYAAVAVTEGGPMAREQAFRRFVGDYYGAEWNDTWADMYTILYDTTPNRKSCSPAWMRPFLPVPWSSDDDLKAAIAGDTSDIPPFTRLLSQLVYCEGTVRRNFDDFLAFRLAIEYIDYVFWRNRAIAAERASSTRSQSSAFELIQLIAERDALLLARLDAAWNIGRPPEAPSKLEPVFNLRPGDQLVYAFRLAAQYSQNLAKSPQQFLRIIAAS